MFEVRGADTVPGKAGKNKGIEGTFSGRAYGTGENGVDRIKEFTEGKFKIARDSIVVIR